MPRKAKIADSTDNFDASHAYTCLACGASWDNPIGHFFKSPWSESYVKNSKFFPVCKTCSQAMYDTYDKKYGTRMACILMCHKIDIPFYHSLFDSIISNNNNFSMGLYLRQINGRQYQYQDFSQTILNKELAKTATDIQEDKEVKWSADEIKNKNEAINIIGYDPFDGYSSNDRRFLFGELVKYFDEDIADDTFKLSQVIQIVNNNNQIRNYDLLISSLNPIKDSNDIKMLGVLKKDLVVSNDKIAKENEISVRNRSNKDAGKSTLTYLQKNLRELNFAKAEADYYDQLKSDGTLWAAQMSVRAIHDHTMFDENDKQEIFEIQRDLIQKLQSELDEALEKVRALSCENIELKNGAEHE